MNRLAGIRFGRRLARAEAQVRLRADLDRMPRKPLRLPRVRGILKGRQTSVRSLAGAINPSSQASHTAHVTVAKCSENDAQHTEHARHADFDNALPDRGIDGNSFRDKNLRFLSISRS